ncbi:hypothetical protein D1AOALGA4SA_8330 [Olavius algarvensis Delta 1 endosymbiont]|nr:hypothetical protein D1AOALGA4SA_8330 [Olavius algarvensis Delta 1 endosymbiont]
MRQVDSIIQNNSIFRTSSINLGKWRWAFHLIYNFLDFMANLFAARTSASKCPKAKLDRLSKKIGFEHFSGYPPARI